MQRVFWLITLAMMAFIGVLLGAAMARCELGIQVAAMSIAVCFLAGSTIALLRKKV